MKKIICLVLAVLVLLCSAVTVSAADSTDALTTSKDCIYFQIPTETSVAWHNFSVVFCHIWSEGNDGGDFFAWQSKDERCEDLGNGYWSYDVSGFEFKEDASYAVIFSNENGMQTYNLSFTSACLGDIVVCEGDTCVNPVDSSKRCTVAHWLSNRDTVHPVAQIGSDGATVDPDGVFNDNLDLSWGNSEGVSIEFPEVEIETEAPTEEETEAEIVADNEKSDSSSINFSIWYIIGGAVVLLIAAVIIIVVISRKKRG
ncbi:MAG: starch-binding protein [Ruminococcus sp.]|nr:starch-binding protein [Ruminococcus sp.]